MGTSIAFGSRRVLVTGARGFLGSHLCDRLVADGAEVHATSRDVVEVPGNVAQWWQTDLLDISELDRLLRKIRPDIVYHLAGHVSAATPIENVLATYHSLLTSTVNLLTVLSSEVACSRIVLLRSLTEPLPGATEQPPSSPYAAAKWSVGAYGRMFHALYRTPVVLARLYMGYGPRQHPSKVIPHAVLSLARGEPPSFSSGTWTADWVYVDDLIEGMARAATAPGLEGETVDLGTGILTPLHEVVRRVVTLMGSSLQPRFGALPDRAGEVVRAADVTSTFARLQWKPTIALDKGLAETVRWFRNASTEPQVDAART